MPTAATPVLHEPSGTAPSLQEPAPRISSQQLLGSRREIVIVHDGREYRLRRTQNGKLILTA
jgi:hemin uptake protein HemP